MAQDKVLEVEQIISRDQTAAFIANEYMRLKSARGTWDGEKRELRNYIFATDTTTTTNASLPWKNSTTRPKLCQIRDNLHANYMAALFPNDDWLEWEGATQDEQTQEKAAIITQYIKTKVNQTDFKAVVSDLVYDYIDYGNAFADVTYEKEEEEIDDKIYTLYEGPRLVRISPLDIVFDITASKFENTFKITRQIMTLGDLQKMITKYPDLNWGQEVFDKMIKTREELGKMDSVDVDKSDGYIADGFGSLSQYYHSGYVEVLIFEGDIFDRRNNKMKMNQQVVIVDRAYIASMQDIPTFSGRSTKRHVSWRTRPDNIYGMGPLDNLVGMQYRIDHIENLQADVFDLIAFPPLKIKGYVEDFEWGPLSQAVMDADGDIEMLKVDSAALGADMKIDRLEQEMEEMAGAPKNAMGIRTPGEKTAYEVQSLENAASRIFQSKISYFEENFLEPLLNEMLASARLNMTGLESIRTLNEFGAVEFQKVNPNDIMGSGRIRPKGARHFAARNNLVQEITQFMQTVGQDPAVANHISGKKIAKLLEDKLGLDNYNLVADNIRVTEQLETEQVIQAGQEVLSEENQLEEGDPLNAQATQAATGNTQPTA